MLTTECLDHRQSTAQGVRLVVCALLFGRERITVFQILSVDWTDLEGIRIDSS
jgi:hypothetical protein